jgi:8-oxo-dGTP pyrophosphatase MutT (NUDIX family)
VACPTLFVHGSRDEFVPLSFARTLYRLAVIPKAFKIIRNGTHTFKDNPIHRQAMIRAVIQFCRQTLQQTRFPVVNAFIRHGKRYLMLKRSQKVGLNKGSWHVVSGYIEAGEQPFTRVWEEITEETGLRKRDLTLIRRGPKTPVQDRVTGRVWVVHPFLFESTTTRVVRDWEHTEHRWVTKQVMRTLPTLKGFAKNVRALGI